MRGRQCSGLSILSKVLPFLGFILLVAPLPLWGQSDDPVCPGELVTKPLVRMVALYSQDLEEFYIKGLCRAIEKHSLGEKVHLEKMSYGDDESAFDQLKEIIQDEKFDVVLGPTDSGVFLRAFKELSTNSKIPVVSPLVAAPFDFDPNRAFFTANVSLTRRSKQLAHTLSKYGLRSIIVLHSNSLFGQQTEAAFREEYLGLKPNANYRPLQYESRGFGEKGPYLKIHQVLLDRPEGLGIFGGREEISKISKLLSEMNATLIPYRPIIFTPIDFRGHEIKDNNIFLVSLSNSEKFGDVEVLTYATVLLLLDQVDPTRSIKSQRADFLKNLVNRFNGGANPAGDRDVVMKFREGRNLADTYVLKRSSKDELSVVAAPGFFEFFVLKFRLLYDTRGWWVVASLAVILVIPITISILDLKGWYRGTVRELLLNKFSLSFIAFNFLIVLVLYLYLAETGRVPYDSPLTALIVAIGPMTFLKSTIFNTAAGKAIGLSSFYDSSMRWLNDKLRTKKFLLKQKFINILAYYNRLDSMEMELKHVFSHARTSKEKEKLNAQLQKELESAESHLDKRIVCAKQLFDEFKWSTLIDKEFVPQGFKSMDPADPDEMLKASARFINDQQNQGVTIKGVPIMNAVNEKVEAVVNDFKKEDLGLNDEKKKRPYHAIRVLVQYGDYGLIWLKRDGFLPENWGQEPMDLNRGFKSKLRIVMKKGSPTDKNVGALDDKG